MSFRKQAFFFLSAVFCMSAATGTHDAFFNNFLYDTFALDAAARGRLEFPRELPGFLVVVSAGLLASLAVTRVAVVGTFVFVCGMAGMVLLGRSFGPMVAMMFLASAGMHLLQPLDPSISLALSQEHNRGKRLGQVGAINTLGTIFGCLLIWGLFKWTGPRYRAGFVCAGLLGACSLVFYRCLHIPSLLEKRPRVVFRRQYGLYYVLELFSGARKQIFLTFGPWVLIQVFQEPATLFAKLILCAAVIGLAFKPLAGMAIDRFGERAVMVADGLVLALVCLGYGYAYRWIDDPERARWMVRGCYVADNLLFSLGSARTVYLSRRALNPQEMTSTLGLGVTVNHAMSMLIPAVAGLVWITYGYERVFLGATVLALCCSALALYARPPKTAPPQ